MKKANIRLLSNIFLIGYTALLAYWMIWGFGRSVGEDFMYNLRPLHTIRLYFRAVGSGASAVNLLGNISVFIPFGLLIPIGLNRTFFKSFMVFVFGVFILETIQLFSRRGSFDVDDLLLNSLGFLAGYVVYHGLRRLT